MTRTNHCAPCSPFSVKRICAAFHGSRACAENLVGKQLLRWELGPGTTGNPISERELYRVPSPPARTAGEEEAPEEKTRALRIEILESQVKDLQARLGPLEKDLLRRQGRRKERARRLESQDRERKSLSKETARSSGKQRLKRPWTTPRGRKTSVTGPRSPNGTHLYWNGTLVHTLTRTQKPLHYLPVKPSTWQ